MASKQDILAAIDQSEQHLQAIADRVRAQPDAPLGDSAWTVRDMLCHIAATSVYEPLLEQVRQRDGDFPTLAHMDATNQRQVATRSKRSVDDLLTEATESFAHARAAVAELTAKELDATGAKMSDGELISLGDMLMIIYKGHATPHIHSIEQALGITV